MNRGRIKNELEKLYPGKIIIYLPKDFPTEILCETDPLPHHPTHSTVIAVIDKSATHYHKVTTETYKVMKGELHLFLNGKKKVVKKGEECMVRPYTIHWAEGNETWAQVYSEPGWTPDDHILIGKEEEIHISPYDPAWPQKFEHEKKLIETCLGAQIFGGVHHVGSTSVPGLSAKPIIDIMVGVKSLEDAKPCIDLLSSIHYQYFPYRPEVMHWFCKPSLEHREYHLHLVEWGSKTWKARLAFRDYLRAHTGSRKAYEDLKLALSEKHRDDREAYTDAKTEFINSIVAKAL